MKPMVAGIKCVMGFVDDGILLPLVTVELVAVGSGER
jgi:hypothetical protein